MEPILEVNHISKTFPVKNMLGRRKGGVSAVDNVSFTLQRKGTLGIVGESGCGKSTLARLVMRLIEPDAGEVLYRESDLMQLSKKDMLGMRRNIQMVFQNPYSSLNPKLTVLDNVAFSLWANAQSQAEARAQAGKFLDAVGLPKSYAAKLPHHLSGGQRQRVAIARALVLNPEIVIADEAVSALDKSVQAQVLNLFQDLKDEFELSLIFISHDLHVVEYMSDEVMVMYLGRVVERGPKSRVFSQPVHPYTQALLKSAPSMDVHSRMMEEVVPLKGELPSPLHPPSGCRFRTRCLFAEERCGLASPPMVEAAPGHEAACFLVKPNQGEIDEVPNSSGRR
ncbi:oligopeptide/dipeptide ABC transporter ATP-binding protein [Paenibacillus sp. HB172176]|uniref:ABC transporter ATP-binding protein n=1 Tax=Paenibacillus sp. HB172176 TaxID=2493690 RepID=UPI001F0F5F0E|nr:oligopeptide/dipeptide ABC transporter ATP-binding protein [Paenibacillus sp. HB172176]